MGRADELSFELTRYVLEELGSEELPVLDALGLDFVEASSAPRPRDGALGFDVAQITVAMAASSVAVATRDYLVEVLKAHAADEGASALRSLINFFKHRRHSELDSGDRDGGVRPAFAQTEIAEVRKRAFVHARGLGLSEAKSNLLADAISGSLDLER